MSIYKQAILGTFLLLLTCSSCLTDTPDIKLHNKCLYPTVMVTLEGRESGGTGVIVRSTRVGNEWQNVFITAGHVVNQPGEFNVNFYEYKDYSTIKSTLVLPCSLYAVDMERDLAIGIFISDKEMPTAEINFDSKIYIGNDVFRIGCGLGDEPRLDVGKVSSVKTELGEHTNLIRTTIYTLPGDSGSALYSDYKIIGIMIMIRAREIGGGVRQMLPGMSYAVPVQNIQTWNSENNSAFSFAWNHKEVIPRLAIYKIKFMRDLEIIDDE